MFAKIITISLVIDVGIFFNFKLQVIEKSVKDHLLEIVVFINSIIKPAINIEQAPNKIMFIVSPAKKCLFIYPNKNAAVICGMTTEKLNTAK